MSSFETIPFNPGLLKALLLPGEAVLPATPESDETLIRFGYEIFPIRDELGVVGDSVFLAMQPGGASDPVEVVGDAFFKVKPVLGRGVLLRSGRGSTATDKVRPQYMDAARGESSLIWRHESYAYVALGDEPFVVRDDAYPDFKAEYEIPATDPELLRRLASYGVEAVAELLKP